MYAIIGDARNKLNQFIIFFETVNTKKKIFI